MLNSFGRQSLADAGCAEWRKSSHSSQSGNCVEVAPNLPGLVAVRDVRVLVTRRRYQPGSLSCTGRHRCEPGGKTSPGDVWSFLDKTRAGTDKPWRRLRLSTGG
jgi:hypothetical protein